jgi:hypothetical protein
MSMVGPIVLICDVDEQSLGFGLCLMLGFRVRVRVWVMLNLDEQNCSKWFCMQCVNILHCSFVVLMLPLLFRWRGLLIFIILIKRLF